MNEEKKGFRDCNPQEVQANPEGTNIVPKAEYNIAVIGSKDAGKTSIIHYLMTGQFTTNFKKEEVQNSLKKRLGVEFNVHLINVHGDVYVLLNIYDFPGDDDFLPLFYFKETDGLIFVYDISIDDEKQNEKLEYWMEQVDRKLSNQKYQHRVIATNKIDLLPPMSPKLDEVANRIKSHVFYKNFQKVYATSAKEGIQIKDMFKDIARDLYGIYAQRQNKKEDSHNLHLKQLQMPPFKKRKKDKCHC